MDHAQQPVGKLRLFFALWPDDATRAALADWSRAIHSVSGGRTMRPETLHVTLAFLGNTDAARLTALAGAAAQVRPRRFTLAFDEAGCWKHNKIVWAGARVSPPELDALSAELRNALSESGFEFDLKPFVPHITLIRNARLGFALPRLAPIVWRVHEFVLVRSTLSSNGSDYVVQRRWG